MKAQNAFKLIQYWPVPENLQSLSNLFIQPLTDHPQIQYFFINTQSKIFQHLATIRHTQAWPVVEKCVLVKESKTNTSLFFYLDFGFPTQYYEGLGV